MPYDAARRRRLARIARQARDLTAERNRLIREERADGVSLREIGKIIGMSHAGVRRVIEQGD